MVNKELILIQVEKNIDRIVNALAVNNTVEIKRTKDGIQILEATRKKIV